MALPLTAWIAREMQLIAVLGSPLLAVLGAFATPSRARTAAADAIRSLSGRLGVRVGRLWRIDGRGGMCGTLGGRRGDVCTRVT